MISAKNIIKSFGKGELELVVLKSISLDIKDGEFVAIVGPSGAGKSTLLYQLSLLDEPNSGEIFFNHQPMSGLSQADKTSVRLREMGFVFQDYALLPELNALENVSLPFIMQGISKSAAAKKAADALKRVGLADKLVNLPSQLSGGQQQRVSIARAIAHDPHILFADEPTANLDTASSRTVIENFLDLHRNGQTIVMVTHETEYAKKATRIIELRDGVIVSDKKD